MPSCASSERRTCLDQRIDVLVRDLVAERHLAHDQRLHGLERQRRIVGETLDDLAGDGLELGWLGDMRDDAQIVEALRRQRIAQQQDAARRHRPRHLQQLLGQEPAGRQADLGERHAEPRAPCWPRPDRNAAPARCRRRSHRPARRPRRAADRSRSRAAWPRWARRPSACADRSRMSRPAQNTGPAARMTARRSSAAGRPRERRLQLGDHLAVERVALVGPVEEDGAHGALDPPCHLGHGAPTRA